MSPPISAPTILAFDTSGPWIGTALLRDGDVQAAQYVEMAKGQAEHLMQMIEETLAKAGTNLDQLDAIGVGVGPGNFTGIRISVAAARGLALALEVPAIGISALEAQAYGFTQPIISSLDARRDKIYTQFFHVGEGSQAVLTELEDAPLPPPRAETNAIGHRAEEIAARTGGRVLQPQLPIADAIARLAAARVHRHHLPRPAPLYIRAADAAPSREQGPVIL